MIFGSIAITINLTITKYLNNPPSLPLSRGGALFKFNLLIK
jgi:hypothetical protein